VARSYIKGPILTVFFLVIMLWSMRILTEGPPLKPATTPMNEFSAERAFSGLSALLEGITAHPAGSDANKLLRSRLVSTLEHLGFTPEVQTDFQCSTLAPGCSYLENVIVVLPGTNSEKPALMAMAHYDSAPAAGGAADDGAGVATLLEVINNLRESDPLKNDVIFLFSDAEESGLRGAMAFNQKHPLMERVGMILNMEARGVAGPSVMFETGPNNFTQVKGFASETPRPVGTSLIVEVYKRMPNGTDLMVFGERGLPALNFAFSRGVSLYHSPLDTIAHLSKSSLQHHGDNMLAAIRYFGDQDLSTLQTDEDATYIDVFGLFVLMWPASLNIWLVCIAAAGLVVMAINVKSSWKKTAWALLSVVLTIVALVIAGWLLAFPLGNWGDLHPLDHPYPWPGRIALILASLLIPALSIRLFAKHLNTSSLFQVVWWLFAIIAIALSLTVTGASYIFLLPVLVASITAVVCHFGKPQYALKIASYVGAGLAAYMAFYHFILLEVVFNFHLSHLKMIALLPLTLAVLPLFLEWRKSDDDKGLLIAFISTTIVATAIGASVPAFTPERPRSTNIVYRADVTTETYNWQLFTFGPEDKAYLSTSGFSIEKQHLENMGYMADTGYLKPAKNLGIEAPTLTVNSDITEGEIRVIDVTAHYSTQAMLSGIGFHPDTQLISLEADSQLVLKDPAPAAHALFMGSDPAGLHLRITAVAGSPVEVRIFDMTPLSLEGEAKLLADLRPEDTAPMHFGDHSVVSRTIRIGE